MSPLPMPARVAAARELLEGGTDEEYGTLPPNCQANLQEAIEFLAAVEDEFDRGGIKK